jgi:predicted transcriptional regulator
MTYCVEEKVKEDYSIPQWMDHAIDDLAEQRDSTRSAVLVEALERFLQNPKDVPKVVEGTKVRPGFFLPSSLDLKLRTFAATQRRKKSLVAIAALTEYLATQKVSA